MAQRIRAVHAAFDTTYGAPRITAELRDQGELVNHKRVARVMRAHRIRGLRLRRRCRTTIPDPAAAKAPDLIGRDFTAPAPNQRYVGDTYLPVGDRGFLYLATVIDLGSRRLAGYAIADHMRTDLVVDALQAAARTRGSRRYTTNSKSRPNSGWNGCVTRTRRYRSSGPGVVDGVFQFPDRALDPVLPP